MFDCFDVVSMGWFFACESAEYETMNGIYIYENFIGLYELNNPYSLEICMVEWKELPRWYFEWNSVDTEKNDELQISFL